MRLCFEVDPAECFRKGIAHPQRDASVEVDPAKLSDTDRNLIADRLDGVNVLQLDWLGGKAIKRYEKVHDLPAVKPILILADGPSYDDLITAIKKNQAEVDAKKNA